MIQARVVSMMPLTDSILQLMLKPDVYVDYQAGQYLQIIHDNETFSYSIANAPLGSHQYELHIRHSQDNPYYQSLFAAIKRLGVVSINVPMGKCNMSCLHPDKPIIFIAGGTGFAPIKAMIEQLLADSDARPMELFWGVRSQSDLYMNDTVLHWQAHVHPINYFPLPALNNQVTLADSVLARHVLDIQDWQIVISGPFDMAISTRDRLVEHGALLTSIFSRCY